MKNWNAGTVSGLERSNSVLQTPSRAPVTRRKKQEMQEQANASDLQFPGFQNSFAQSSPHRSPTKPLKSGTQGKAKNKEKSQDGSSSILFSPSKGPPRAFVFDDIGGDEPIQDYDAEAAPEPGDGSPRRRTSRLQATKHGPDVPDTPSVNGVELPLDFDDNQVDVDDRFRGIDWKEEVSHPSPICNPLAEQRRTVSPPLVLARLSWITGSHTAPTTFGWKGRRRV